MYTAKGRLDPGALLKQYSPLVRRLARPGDIVMCLGAGTITQWAYALPGQLEAFDKAAS